MNNNHNIYLQSTYFIDWDSPSIIEFVKEQTSEIEDPADKVIHLYYWVRDQIRYDFDHVTLQKFEFIASRTLKKESAFCIPKAVLLAALARAVGVPSRLGFADVRNHLATEKLLKKIRNDLFVFHGYTELFLYGKWVKATPAFNSALCEKFNVNPLEFNGREDSIFHEYNHEQKKYMEYVKDYGNFPDLPYEQMLHAFKEAYPHFFHEENWGWPKV